METIKAYLDGQAEFKTLMGQQYLLVLTRVIGIYFSCS